MVCLHWLSLRLGQGPEPGRTGCMVLRLEEPFTLHLNRDREEWVCTHVLGPETVSGSVF